MRIPGVPYIQGRWSYADPDGKHYGIAIHATANTASDTNEALYAARRGDQVSFHLVVDGDSITQSLSLTARAGHAGSTYGNDHAIAVEVCGLTTRSRAKWLSSVAWTKLANALAWIIRNDPDFKGFQVRRATVAEMKRNPKVRAFYGHDDMRRAWGGTTHTDPGANFPWDHLIKTVNSALGKTPVKPPTSSPTTAVTGGKSMAVKSWDDDVIPLWGARKTKANPTARVSWVLSSVGAWSESTKKQVAALAAGQSKILSGQAAILAAVRGDTDAASILARVDEIGAQVVDEIRGAADQAAAHYGELSELVYAHARGEIEADETIRLIGEKLLEASGDAGEQDIIGPAPQGGQQAAQ